MASKQVLLRTLVLAAIDAAKGGYVITGIPTEAAYFPQENLEGLVGTPKIKLALLGFDNNRQRKLRNHSTEAVVPIQVCLQQFVAPDNVTQLDKLVEVQEQLFDTCEDDFISGAISFSWLESRPLRDDNELAYSYQQLVQDGVFQAIFTSYYKYQIIRNC